MRRLLPLLVLAAGLVAGCGSPDVPPTAPSPTIDVSEPASVEIPKIGASSSLIALGTTDGGGWAVPDVNTPGQASWYSESVPPGEVGPAVILGHVNGRDAAGKSVPGVFAELTKLKVGDKIIVRSASGAVTTFTVTDVDQTPKTNFPTRKVLGDADSRRLTLVTCGGSFNPAAHSYRDSIIVYAVATEQTAS